MSTLTRSLYEKIPVKGVVTFNLREIGFPIFLPQEIISWGYISISTNQFAHMLDSLVRVTRRVDEKHFVRVAPALDR